MTVERRSDDDLARRHARRETINFHPHIHALVSRGGWTEGGQWIPVPWVDANAAELLFRHKVFSLLRKAGLIDEDRIALLLSWKYTGFSVHNSVTVQPEDAGATERLVRYLMRAPVSQERLELDPDLAQVRLLPKGGADDERSEDEVERLDPDEAVARIIAQVPEPRKHLIHSYGHYADAARAKRAREAAATPDSAAPAVPPPAANEPDSAERKAARKRWANLIRHIYEVDPLVCPRCGGMMKIIAFITERRVIRAILDSVPARELARLVAPAHAGVCPRRGAGCPRSHRDQPRISISAGSVHPWISDGARFAGKDIESRKPEPLSRPK